MFKQLNQHKFQDFKAETIHGKRWYFIDETTKYPSITTILNVKEKEGIKNWRLSLGEKKASKEMKRCATRGTNVHQIIENYLNNANNPTYKHEHSDIKLFNQMKIKLNKIDNITAQEVALYSKHLKIAGRVDCIGEYNGVNSIIDFKTSNNNKSKEMIFDYFLQATAYAIMYNELYEESIEDIAIIIGVERGMMPLVYTDKIYEYIKPLLKRIREFHDDNNV